MVMKRIFNFLTLSLFLMTCGKDDQLVRLNIKLTDAPGDYEEVNIDIQGIEINSHNDDNSGWKSLDVRKGVYNILELSNGLDTLLAIAELPSGKVSQIRLVLGEKNSVMIDGQRHPLSAPSAQQSGLKLAVHAELIEGVTYTFVLDFDAARSIVKTGSGNYILKPVIRVLNEATSGSIKGSITPPEASPAVFAILNADTVATAYTDETGAFLLRGIPGGSYTVSFDPKEGYEPLEKTNIAVTVATITDLGWVEMD
jgi:hypothetical protein